MRNQYQEFAKALGITKEFRIVLKNKHNKKADAKYWGMYTGEILVYHLIHVYMLDACRDLDTLIAHELIHANQEEMGLNEVHGLYFQTEAKRMERKFGLSKIYIPDTDTP
jgi:hypothetical protein